MYNLTEDEKAYLRIAYDKGYRYVATDEDSFTCFYTEKPPKGVECWGEANCTGSLVNFGTSWKDNEPTKIADLLGIDDTDWSQVKPFTPVWVRDNEGEEWEKALFLKRTDDIRTPFMTTYYAKWTDDGSWEDWTYCRLATQKEIDEVTGENRA